MRLRVCPVEVVRVVRSDERQVHLPSELDEALVDDVLFRNAVAHNFDIKAIAENVDELARSLLRAFVIVAQKRLRAERRHTAREHDQPIVMPGQEIHVDARLVVITLEEPLRDQRDQIAIPDDIGRQQRDVGFIPHRAVEAAARCDVCFAADDRDERMLVGRIIELHRPKHHAVIRQGDPRCAAVGRAAAQILDAASSI